MTAVLNQGQVRLAGCKAWEGACFGREGKGLPKSRTSQGPPVGGDQSSRVEVGVIGAERGRRWVGDESRERQDRALMAYGCCKDLL